MLITFIVVIVTVVGGKRKALTRGADLALAKGGLLLHIPEAFSVLSKVIKGHSFSKERPVL